MFSVKSLFRIFDHKRDGPTDPVNIWPAETVVSWCVT